MLRGNSVEIHVGLTDVESHHLADHYRAAGCSVICLDLDGVTSIEELVDRISAAFLFPYRVSGLDAALDLMSDLEWFGNDVGYVVVLDGLGSIQGRVSGRLLKILPAVADRWRSQRRTFQVLVLDDGTSPEDTLAGLSAGNQLLAEAARHEWASDTGPVPVIEHSRPWLPEQET